MSRRGNGEGSVYKQRNGLWAASITLEGGQRKYLYGKTRKEVQEKLATTVQQQKQGMLIATPQQTVGQFFNRLVGEYLQTERASQNLRTV